MGGAAGQGAWPGSAAENAGQTFPMMAPTAAQVGWKPALSGPRALITSWSAFES